MVTKGDLEELNIKWSLNGQLIITGENGLTIVKMSPRLSALSIESINAHHRGNYKCIAENAAGNSDFSAELKVNGVID